MDPVSRSSTQLSVFGANGRVGKVIVREALARGYHVKAFVHHRHDFEADPQLTIVHGDIYNSADVKRAVEGSSAVISTLGSWGTPKKDILSAGMANIIPAMQSAGIARIVSLTGADARASGDTLGLIHRITYPLLQIVAPKILADGEKHIVLLESSELDWTVLRSPVIVGGKKATYTLSSKRPLPWSIVRRHAVANAIVDLIGSTDNVRTSPFVQDA